MSQGCLLSDQLCVAGPLKPSQLQRLKLVSKLFTAVQVAGTINDPSLCLQAIVLCFGLVSPMVQHSIVARPLLEVLLYCHAVLVELPEQILIGGGKDSSATASLHHIVAATAYYVGKVCYTLNKNTRVVMYMYMYIMKSMGIVSLIYINFLDFSMQIFYHLLERYARIL